MLKLTEKFYEYFDVEGSKDIRKIFNKVVGQNDQTKVDDFDERELIENLSKEDSNTSEPETKTQNRQDAEKKKDNPLEPEEFGELE